jgi:formylglycine-generating enzyme required for sulfatase activity
VWVSWNDAMAFCKWLSGVESRVYRLPTEAEWEYVCRGGTTTRFWCGEEMTNLPLVANVHDQSSRQAIRSNFEAGEWDDGYPFTAPVGRFKANPFGVYDILGNVYEWCHDHYDPDYYQKSPAMDPQGPESGETHVVRGSGWVSRPFTPRSARRRHYPQARMFVGFRVVCENL